MPLNMDDILQDTIALFGEEPEDDGSIHYGPLLLKTAPKVRQCPFQVFKRKNKNIY